MGVLDGIEVRVADPALAARIEEAIARRMQEVLDADPPPSDAPVTRVRDLADVAGAVGAIAVVPVGCFPGRKLLAVAEALETASAAGIQLVWSGRGPREAAVFAVMEAWRGRKTRTPLLLGPTEHVLPALRRAISRA